MHRQSNVLNLFIEKTKNRNSLNGLPASGFSRINGYGRSPFLITKATNFFIHWTEFGPKAKFDWRIPIHIYGTLKFDDSYIQECSQNKVCAHCSFKFLFLVSEIFRRYLQALAIRIWIKNWLCPWIVFKLLSKLRPCLEHCSVLSLVATFC